MFLKIIRTKRRNELSPNLVCLIFLKLRPYGFGSSSLTTITSFSVSSYSCSVLFFEFKTLVNPSFFIGVRSHEEFGTVTRFRIPLPTTNITTKTQ